MKRRTSQKLLSRLSTAMCTALLCFSVTAAEYMPNFKDTDINEFINIVGKKSRAHYYCRPQRTWENKRTQLRHAR